MRLRWSVPGWRGKGKFGGGAYTVLFGPTQDSS
jgi:hypothetical protein